MSIRKPVLTQQLTVGKGPLHFLQLQYIYLVEIMLLVSCVLTALPTRYYSDWWDHTISKFKFLIWWEIAHQFSSVQSLSHVQLFATPWTAAHQASLSITNSWSLLKLMSIESVMPSNHLILCCPLHLPPSIFSSIRVFSNESALRIRWFIS